MIEIRDLSHRYGALQALRDVSFDVPKGAVVGLVGPNGAGKTTLIRAIATLLRQGAGHVRVDGVDTVAYPIRARTRIGYLPERATPYGELLAWEHLDVFGRIAGLSGASLQRAVDAALDAAGLADRRDAPCATLSKGLRQRLALHATLLHDPPCLVLDEPTDGLDPDSRDALLATARDLASRGRAVLLSSHVLAELESVADEVRILSAGCLVDAVAETGVQLRVVLREGAMAALDALMAHPAVASASIDGEAAIVLLAPDQTDGADVVAHLVGAGLSVVAAQPLTRTLRDRYRAAVGAAP
jgi:ABC-2 type transport system ATP-binding protein